MAAWYQQPKKIKGAHKKERAEVIERLQCKFPTLFEGKTEREIIRLVGSFKATGKHDDEFIPYCIAYEAMIEKKRNEKLK